MKNSIPFLHHSTAGGAAAVYLTSRALQKPIQSKTTTSTELLDPSDCIQEPEDVVAVFDMTKVLKYSWGDKSPFKGKNTAEGTASSVALSERLGVDGQVMESCAFQMRKV